MASRNNKKRSVAPTKLRGVIGGLVFAAVVFGVVFSQGWGTLSAFGLQDIYLLCPLGALESMVGSHSIAVHVVVAFLVIALLVVVLGKSFCAWACPVGFLSGFLQGKKAKEAQRKEQQESSELALSAYQCAVCGEGDSSDAHGGVSASVRSEDGVRPSRKKRKGSIDSRHFVLLGALGSSWVFGFPVFCAVCPIGLCFATVVAVVRLVGFNEPSWGLLLFPAIIAFELVVLRKWCHTLCPVGALMSLLSSFNRTLRPKADESLCLRTSDGQGRKACAVCSSVCPELADPRADLGLRPLLECTRCGKCVEACPQGAISFRSIEAKKD